MALQPWRSTLYWSISRSKVMKTSFNKRTYAWQIHYGAKWSVCTSTDSVLEVAIASTTSHAPVPTALSKAEMIVIWKAEETWDGPLRCGVKLVRYEFEWVVQSMCAVNAIWSTTFVRKQMCAAKHWNWNRFRWRKQPTFEFVLMYGCFKRLVET